MRKIKFQETCVDFFALSDACSPSSKTHNHLYNCSWSSQAFCSAFSTNFHPSRMSFESYGESNSRYRFTYSLFVKFYMHSNSSYILGTASMVWIMYSWCFKVHEHLEHVTPTIHLVIINIFIKFVHVTDVTSGVSTNMLNFKYVNDYRHIVLYKSFFDKHQCLEGFMKFFPRHLKQSA